MPAVTADPTTLPHLAAPAGAPRTLRSVTTAPEGFEGEGFPVRRAFAGVSLADLDPFIHMDQMGPIVWPPMQAKGTDWHPHRGFETVTYIVDGTFLHQDSHGGGGVISDGATQWMTAGSGILHIETPPEELVRRGGLFHGIQLWVNLPSRSKMLSPAYQNLEASDVTLLASADDGAIIRVIAGEIDGNKGPGSTHTPITLAHVTVSPGARVVLPWHREFNALAYGLEGVGAVGAELAGFGQGRLALFGEGDTIVLQAAEDSTLEVLLLGGEPIREPVAAQGPFVMNTREELLTAFEDFRAGRMGSVPAGGLRPFRG
ncbi:MAG: pirin family protein [Acidobacteria bacterium]|nr:pirin family protein [Acidobacteriota bacterium]